MVQLQMFHNGLPSKVTGRQKRHTVASLFSTPPSRLGKTHMLWRTCAWHLGFSPALAHATLFLTAFLSLLFLSLTHSQHTLTHNTHTLSLTHSFTHVAWYQARADMQMSSRPFSNLLDFVALTHSPTTFVFLSRPPQFLPTKLCLFVH